MGFSSDQTSGQTFNEKLCQFISLYPAFYNLIVADTVLSTKWVQKKYVQYSWFNYKLNLCNKAILTMQVYDLKVSLLWACKCNSYTWIICKCNAKIQNVSTVLFYYEVLFLFSPDGGAKNLLFNW